MERARSSRRPEISDTDVAGLLRKVGGDCTPDAESKNIEVVVEGADDEVIWAVDAGILAPALHNRMGNAIDALADHGGTRMTALLRVLSDQGEMRISIADDGPGIPDEIQRRIFDPFFSTKGKQGTGLGLAGVKKGVEEHGGRVLLDSKEGQGSKFTLVLPAQ